MAMSIHPRAGTPGNAWFRGIALLLAVLAAMVRPAAAQPRRSNVIASEALFEQGRTLMQQKQYAQACEKFEASHKLDPSVGALLNLGDCRQQLGQTASAWGRYREAAALARSQGDERREQFAHRRADMLEAELSYLIIDVPDQVRVPELRVSRNGEPVSPALWNQRAPVDPGRYVIRAEAPGRVPHEARVDIAPGGGETRVAIPALQPGDAEPGGATHGGGSHMPAHVRPPRGGTDGPGMPLGRKVALASGAAGLAGLVAGTVLGVQARSRWNDAKATCMDDRFDRCTATGVRLSQEAIRKGNQSTVAFSVGIAATAAAAILWYITPPARADAGTSGRDTAFIQPVAGPDMLGARAHVRF